MSLHHAAQHLADKGRGPDTELVHMSKNELKGLQSLAMAHGGSLTVNPDTGLVEAGFLENMLPMVIGAGLAATGVGAPMAALMVGGGYGLATGSMEKGLIAGLGAYGGAGLGAGLAEAGAQTVAQGAGEAAGNEAVKAAAVQGSTAPIANIADAGASLGTPGGITPTQYSDLASTYSGAYAPAAVTPPNPTFAQNLDYMGKGLPQVGSVMMQNPGTTMAAAMPLLQTPQERISGYTGSDQYDQELARYRLSPDFQGSTPVQPNPYYQANYATYAAGGGLMDSYAPGGPVEQMSLENQNQNQFYPQAQQIQTRFSTPTQMPVSAEVMRSDYDTSQMLMASGGIASYAGKNSSYIKDPLPESTGIPRTGIYRDSDVDTARKDAFTAAGIRLGKIAKGANIKLAAMPKAGIKGLGQIDTEAEMASGGTAHLGGYSDGGRMLKGPGDGMSDSIPASISGKQPARLADGEFVVPADVVSHLGNGSTDAGAKKLYKMMDNIRKARTGKKKQAPAVKANKYIPA
jgi:hypothetical protein